MRIYSVHGDFTQFLIYYLTLSVHNGTTAFEIYISFTMIYSLYIDNEGQPP